MCNRFVISQFDPKDNNTSSVVFYAVEKLGVKDSTFQAQYSVRLCTLTDTWSIVVIVGHSECGGATACLTSVQNTENIGSIAEGSLATMLPDPEHGITAASPLNRCLEPLTRHVATLQLKGEKNPLQKVVEENVKFQVKRLAESDMMKHAWGPSKKKVKIHGWVYDLASGKLKDLGVSVPASAD